MDTRPAWKGALKFSLIVIPVRAFSATRQHADVAFKQFHRKCHTPIQLKKWCPHCKEEVANDAIVKGHEASKGRFVFAEESEIAALRPKSSQTIDISSVMDASVIDARYIERVYYLTPDSDAAASAFAVVRKALTGKAAVGHLTFHGREYLTAVVADDKAMLMYTLRTAGEVVAKKDLPAIAAGVPKADEVRLARRVLDSFVSGARLDTFVDNYQAALRKMLAQKGVGRAAEPNAETATSGKVVNLMDALRRSLDAVPTHAMRSRRAPRRLVPPSPRSGPSARSDM